jgi:hypothetical protein
LNRDGCQHNKPENHQFRFSNLRTQDYQHAKGKQCDGCQSHERIQHALWHMPAGINRFSPCQGPRPDVGGDDWVSQTTYEWMQRNIALLNAVNDASGEHGRNIGHPWSHATGNDMFHFRVFGNNRCWGADNYHAIDEAVIRALQGGPIAINAVTDWVQDTRDGADALLQLQRADRIRVLIQGSGCIVYRNQRGVVTDPVRECDNAVVPAHAVELLPHWWMRDLVQSGRLEVGGNRLRTGLGNWANRNDARLHYNSIHNDHVHIGL